MVSHQFQSNSQLLVLYLKELLPTSKIFKFGTFPSSCGRVFSLFAFRKSVVKFFNFGRSSEGRLVSLFPLRYISSRLTIFGKKLRGKSTISLNERFRTFNSLNIISGCRLVSVREF